MKLQRKQIFSALGALAAGLLAFFVLECAVARRIGADLFLPLDRDAGALLPGRLARLAACLVLGFALVMTEQGRRLRRALDRLCDRDRGRWAVSAAVTALFFLWAWRVTVFSFKTNDDTQILQAIGSGSYWSLGVAFTHPWLCAVFAWLYRLAPGVYWYAGYHLTVQALALTVFGRCLLLKLRRRGWPAAAAALAQWLWGTGMFLCTLALLSFTVTPAIAGAAAVALTLCREETDSAAGRAAVDVGSVLLMVLCYLQRPATGQVLLCFWALALGYQLLRALLRAPKGRRLRQTARPILCAALVLAVCAGAEKAPRQYRDDWATGYSYSMAEYYRSTFMDYALDKLSDEQLAAVGMPPELAELFRQWYFMDERVNTDTFRAAVEAYPDVLEDAIARGGVPADSVAPADSGESADDSAAPSDSGTPTKGGLAGLFTRLRSMIVAATPDAIMISPYRHIAAFMAVGLGLLVLLVLLRLARYGLAGWPETLCGLCAGGGALLLLLYLLLQGRMPLRAFLVPVTPGVAVMALMAADAPTGEFRTKPKRLAALLSGVLALGLAALCPAVARYVPYTDEAVSRREVFQFQNASEACAAAHPETLFITNELANDLDPFHAPDAYPANLMRWGNPGVTASSQRLYADTFFRDDVRFLYKQELNTIIVMMLQYFSLDHGPVQMQRESLLTDTYAVAVFSLVGPGEEGYTGWYEQNDMTYYFRDGQAVTGQQVIDGQTYTFAPAGAAASFYLAVGPDGPVFTTDAYSLIDGEAPTP